MQVAAPEDLVRLVYLSTAQMDDAESDLRDIQQTSLRFNRKLGITGVLLHRSGCFLGILEGNPPFVDKLFESIRDDRRHRDVRVIARRPCSTRTAAAWSMGVLNLEGPSPIDGPNIEQVRELARLSDQTDEHAGAELIRVMTMVFADQHAHAA